MIMTGVVTVASVLSYYDGRLPFEGHMNAHTGTATTSVYVYLSR